YAFAKGPQSGVSESHYWARMNNMVRQLRSKYPGYRAEIDEMVGSVTGSKPANALRSALFNEWNAAAEADPYQKLVDKAMWEGRLPADFFQRQETGNAYGLTELKSYVATRERQAADISDQKAQLEFANSTGTLNTKEALRTFQAETSQSVVTMLADSATTVGQTYTALSERIQEDQRSAARGEPVDVTYQKTALAELKGLVSTQLRQLSLQQFGDTAGDSYVSMISDPKELDAAIAQAMWPINLMEDAILNENYGTAQALAAWLESVKNSNSKELLDAFPEVGRIQ